MTIVEHSRKFAAELHQAGRFAEAEQLYRQIIALNPMDGQTHYLLGSLKIQQGDPDAATRWLRRAVDIKPQDGVIYLALGNAHFACQRLAEAIAAYREAIRWAPDSFESYGNLGTALHSAGNYLEAIESCQRAVDLRPDLAETHFNLAMVLKYQGSHSTAVQCFQQAIAIRADFFEALMELGSAFGEMGQMRSAAEIFTRATEFRPESSDAYFGLGGALQELDDLQSSVEAFQKANQLKPGCADANLANLMQHLCQWEGLHEVSQRVVASIEQFDPHGTTRPCNPFIFMVMATPTTAAQQLSCAKHYLQSTGITSVQPISLDGRARKSELRSKLRIGYLSADFYVHATARLIAELFESHDRQRFEIYGYSIGIDDGSPIRKRIFAGLDHIRNINELSYAAAARLIADDRIDILVDLKGYTQHARTQIFAARPAPIQVNYLGYPGTMGADFIDYILVDDFIVPVDQQPYFTEKLVYLPGCYQVNDSHAQIVARTPSRSECGLPEGSFVFCSFNDPYKITPLIFDHWMRLLRARPRSVLWLLETNRFVAANLRRESQFRGVAAERLVFAPRTSYPEHLARHRLADIFLDTFPVNAHTTASDALRMGLPLLTLAGETFVSRVAGSLLRAVGLPELIANSYEEYEAIARRLSDDCDELTSIRNRLSENLGNCELYDGKAFARKIEAAYEAMWGKWQPN